MSIIFLASFIIIWAILSFLPTRSVVNNPEQARKKNFTILVALIFVTELTGEIGVQISVFLSHGTLDFLGIIESVLLIALLIWALSWKDRFSYSALTAYLIFRFFGTLSIISIPLKRLGGFVGALAYFPYNISFVLELIALALPIVGVAFLYNNYWKFQWKKSYKQS